MIDQFCKFFDRNYAKIRLHPDFTFNFGADLVFIIDKTYSTDKINKIAEKYKEYPYKVYGVLTYEAPNEALHDWISFQNLILLNIADNYEKVERIIFSVDNHKIEIIEYDLGNFVDLFKLLSEYSKEYLCTLLYLIKKGQVSMVYTENGKIIIDNQSTYGKVYDSLSKKVCYALVAKNSQKIPFPYFKLFIEAFMEEEMRDFGSINIHKVICFLIESIINKDYSNFRHTPKLINYENL
ncbi:MAG: hypothetical protein MUC49_02205 [Raineya sp.]|nr:hypothetical protein [Raineya sp.]